jgi:hypothetical protein
MDKALIDKIVLLLLVVGGLNWGLIGIINLNLVDVIFSFAPVLAKVIYIIVGVCGLYGIKMLLDKK